MTTTQCELTFESAAAEARDLLADLREKAARQAAEFLVEAGALTKATTDPEIIAPALAFAATDESRAPETIPEFIAWMTRIFGGYLRATADGDLFAWGDKFQGEIEAAVEEDRLGRGWCRTCTEPVLWAQTENRKNIPLDPEPRYYDEGARFLLDTEAGLAVHYRSRGPQPDGALFRFHLEQCESDD